MNDAAANVRRGQGGSWEDDFDTIFLGEDMRGRIWIWGFNHQKRDKSDILGLRVGDISMFMHHVGFRIGFSDTPTSTINEIDINMMRNIDPQDR